MPPVGIGAILEHYYTQLKESGHFDTDWIDTLGWVVYILFMGLLIL